MDSIEAGKQDFKQTNSLSYIEADASVTLQNKSLTENKLVNKNLTQRLLSGVIGAAVFITFLVFNFYTFAFITALMLGLVLNEFYLMSGKYKPLRFLGLLIGLSSYGLVLLNHNKNVLKRTLRIN